MNLVAAQFFLMSLLAIKRRGLLVLLLALPVCAQDAIVADSTLPASVPAQPMAVDAEVVPAQPAVTNTSAQPVIQSKAQANNPVTPTNTTAPIGSGRHLMNVTLALLGVIGLIFAISWFVKRFSHGTFSANTHIKIISAMPLGTRERIVLIDAGGQQLLLGITSTNINTLHVFETPIDVDSKEDSQSDFSRKLMSILQQKSPLSSAADTKNKNNSAP